MSRLCFRSIADLVAPVKIEREVSREDLMLLAAHDDDAFARYEAMQELVVGHLMGAATGSLSDADRAAGEDAIVDAFAAVLSDESLDDSMCAELMALPGVTYLAEQVDRPNPSVIHVEREGLKQKLGERLSDELRALYQRAASLPYSLEGPARGARKIKAQALALLAASNPDLAAELAVQQYRAANNMTDRQSALMVLCGLETPARQECLDDFYARFKGNALVIDKWFTLQALSLHPQVLEHVAALAGHPDFTLQNPNRVRSLYMALAGNPHAFHDAGGAGYRMIADLILALDPINAQTAARFVPSLGRWRRIEEERSRLMRQELERISAAGNLSRDTGEQVARSLG